MQENAVRWLNLSSRSLELKEESNRLTDASEGLLEDSFRLRDAGIKLRSKVRECLANPSRPRKGRNIPSETLIATGPKLHDA
jgi:hypothetical protein